MPIFCLTLMNLLAAISFTGPKGFLQLHDTCPCLHVQSRLSEMEAKRVEDDQVHLQRPSRQPRSYRLRGTVAPSDAHPAISPWC